MTKCTICGKELTDLETFGEQNHPMCMTHWFELMFDGGNPNDMYDWGELQHQEWEWIERNVQTR